MHPRAELSLPSAEQQDLVSGSTPVRWMRHVAQGHDAVPQLKGFRRKAFFFLTFCVVYLGTYLCNLINMETSKSEGTVT